MATCAIGMTPILIFLFEFAKSNSNTTKQVAHADDFAVSGKITEWKEYWDILLQIGPKYDYFPSSENSFLIVKAFI